MAREMGERGPRFSYHMIDMVRRAALSAVTSNADIARVLRRRDPRISVSDVVKWRDQIPKFNHACNDALSEQLEQLANVLFEAGMEGSERAATYMLDRLHPAFMPKSKNETTLSGETIDEMLKRRALTNEELRDQGVIRERTHEPLEDDDT